MIRKFILNINSYLGPTFCVVEADVVVVTVDLPGVVVRVIFTGVTPMGNATVLDGGCCCMEILGIWKYGGGKETFIMIFRRNIFSDKWVSILIIFFALVEPENYQNNTTLILYFIYSNIIGTKQKQEVPCM
jgi:hypothetical protein